MYQQTGQKKRKQFGGTFFIRFFKLIQFLEFSIKYDIIYLFDNVKYTKTLYFTKFLNIFVTIM